jgi:hypothetical protein
MTSQHHSLYIKIRELNLQALEQHVVKRAAPPIVFTSSVELAAPQSSQSYVKHKFMGPQYCHDGQHPDAIIKDFKALLNNTQDAMHRVAIHSSTWEIINYRSHNMTYISDKQLPAMVLCIYHGINVEVEGLERERMCQICRYTGSQSWCRGDRQNDWV